ncbi:hypothetical protein JTB14_028123 [Gonioctena quinquepunctata]|nr:hypothetical protein JTB14_028123 [Gonioctena quinquepunctata]
MSTEDREKVVSDVRDVLSAENDCLPPDSAGSNEHVMESHAHRYENILPSLVVSEIEPLRKSSRIRKPVNIDDFVVNSAETIFEPDDPIDIEDALSRSDAKLWKEATKEEYEALIENETWFLTDLPPNRKSIGVNFCSF